MKKVLCSLIALALLPAFAGAGEKKSDPSKIPSLIEELKKKDDPNARLTAAMELADFGPTAKDAVPALVKLLDDGDEDMRLNAALTLSKIGKAAVEPLIGLLDSKDADARFYAVW